MYPATAPNMTAEGFKIDGDVSYNEGIGSPGDPANNTLTIQDFAPTTNANDFCIASGLGVQVGCLVAFPAVGSVQ